MVRKLLGIALCVVGAILLLAGVGAHAEKSSAYIILFLAGAALIVLGGKRIFGKGKAKPNPVARPQQPAAAPTPIQTAPTSTESVFDRLDRERARRERAGVISFRIAGVTFKGRQTTLRKIATADDDSPYGMCTFGLEPTEYEGNLAYTIVAKLWDDEMTEKEIGMVPAAMVDRVQRVYDNVFDVDVEVYGGPDDDMEDKSYGAQATLYFDQPT